MTDFANRIIKTMKTLGYKVFEDGELNIVYVEGIDPDGEPNSDNPNLWNDLRTIIKVIDGNAQFLGKWRATTEPGNYYTHNPMNPGGAARIAFGQYKAWQVGTHGNSQPHEALVQSGGAVKVHRDLNKDFVRTGDKVNEGYYGINQHWGYDQSEVGRASAGCLVGQSRDGHREFMAIAKTDTRYRENSKYVFWSTVLDGSQLL
jgi:hypothetical protein